MTDIQIGLTLFLLLLANLFNKPVRILIIWFGLICSLNVFLAYHPLPLNVLFFIPSFLAGCFMLNRALAAQKQSVTQLSFLPIAIIMILVISLNTLAIFDYVVLGSYLQDKYEFYLPNIERLSILELVGLLFVSGNRLPNLTHSICLSILASLDRGFRFLYNLALPKTIIPSNKGIVCQV